ncbi:MAG: C-terminal helicase domain-containing protein, partial [Chloroflexi bacterium]|nr:C-terminal helicase domain-containing protein [Chloroflexota bacterium]
RHGSTRPVAPRKPSTQRADVAQVLSPVFIRRRRYDIRDLYGDTAEINGRPVQFPEPKLENISYRLDRVYARAGSFEDITAMLQRHKASRYQAAEYLCPEAREKARYAGLVRSSDRVAGLMKVLLLKRLESSVAAFRSTLESLIRSNRHFREALEAGYVPVGTVATRLINGQEFDADEAFEILNQEDARDSSKGAAHPVEDFRVAEWINDLDADYALLSDLHTRVQSVTPDDDDKLRALRGFLERSDVAGGKVLIFSEAETTIDYLYEQLNPGGENTEIERLTGSNRDRAESIVGRFSPQSNLPPERRERINEIRVLLATDVVSEGQNLQDCARVLNYDLHWNPVRLIQRFGRVDRIGTEHDVIHLQSMWPDVEVDQNLDLTDRLNRRIQLFHDLIGLDNQLLSETEQLNAKAMYRIYGDQQLPDADDGFDDVSVHQRAVATLQRMRDEQPELWDTIKSLPDGIRSALIARPFLREQPTGDSDPSEMASAGEPTQPALLSPSDLRPTTPRAFDEPQPGETLVLLGAGEIDSCYAVGDDLEPRPISPAQFITHAECKPETPGAPLPAGTNERVMAAFGRFSQELGQRLGHSRRPRNTRARRFVSKQLNIARLEANGNESEVRRIDDLRQIFGGPLSTQAEEALSDVLAIQPEGAALLARLEAICERYRLRVVDSDAQTEPPEQEVIRIVCSDGLLG